MVTAVENSKRLYLDVVKGITIFLMLWTHCIQYCAMGSFDSFANPVYKAVYSFHMPLFMLVSGYLFFFSFQKRDLKKLLVHRAQSLLQPIVFCTIFNNLLMNLAYSVLSGSGQFLDGHLLTGMTMLLWFLWCVLASSTAVGLACKASEKGWLQGILLCGGMAFVALFPEKDFQLFMYPFFVGGFLFAKHRKVLLNWIGKWKYAVLLIFPMLLPRYEWTHYIYLIPFWGTEYPGWFYLKTNAFRFLIGFSGSAFVLVLVELVLRKLASCRFVRAIGKLGENSLQIYCLSVPLLSGYLPIVYEKLMQPFGCNLLAANMLLFNGVFTPLLAAAYCAGLYLLVVILKKSGLHGLLFGR